MTRHIIAALALLALACTGSPSIDGGPPGADAYLPPRDAGNEACTESAIEEAIRIACEEIDQCCNPYDPDRCLTDLSCAECREDVRRAHVHHQHCEDDAG